MHMKTVLVFIVNESRTGLRSLVIEGQQSHDITVPLGIGAVGICAKDNRIIVTYSLIPLHIIPYDSYTLMMVMNCTPCEK
jgi:hypothetical protein